jgi:hypothetical protein
MNPVQSQPLGQYFPPAPMAPSGGAPVGLSGAQASVLRSAQMPDGLDTNSCLRRPLPGPIVGGANPDPSQNGQQPPAASTPGSTGNSFLDLISNLMSQLDSVISGLGGGTTAAAPGGSSPLPPVSMTPVEPDPGSPSDPGGFSMQRFLESGQVT